MSEMENNELDCIEMVDDEGNTVLMQVLDYFFYNGEEYVILTDYIPADEEEEAPEEVDCYVMKVHSYEEDGEELEEFLPIEDDKLEQKLMEIASTRLNEDDELDD